jgi:hypothetical protein
MANSRKFDSVIVPLFEENSIIGAAQSKTSKWRFEFLEVPASTSQIAIYTMEDLNGRLSIDGTQFAAGLR